MPWQSCGDYDVNLDVALPLRVLTRMPETVHLGSRRGDVTSIPLRELDRSCDGLVSGPPCPPFSTIGKRLLQADARAHVFWCVCRWIEELSKHQLTWFVLENVPGILKRKRDES